MFIVLLPPAGCIFLWVVGKLTGISDSDIVAMHLLMWIVVSVGCPISAANHGVSNRAMVGVWLWWSLVIGVSSLAAEHPWMTAVIALCYFMLISLLTFMYVWFRPTSEDCAYGYRHPELGVCLIRTNGRSLHETEKEVRKSIKEARLRMKQLATSSKPVS